VPLPSLGPGQSAPAASGTPNVVGKSVADATATLLGAGYGLVEYDVDNNARGSACAIARQQPAAGTAVTRGSVAQVWYVPGKDCLSGVKKGKGD
jgi:beta-lactam-binding protein with PASTA domain